MKKSKILLSNPFINLAYLLTLFFMYGEIKSSISSYAKELIRDNREWMLLIWLVSLFVTTTWVSLKERKWWSLLLYLSGFTLLPIIFFSGYYPGFENHDVENVVHVLSVFISIPCAYAYIILDGIMMKRKLFAFLITGSFGLFLAAALWWPTIPKHTYWIEVFSIYSILSYLIFRKNERESKKSVEMV